MGNMPTPFVDRNPVGRHGHIGIDILPHDIPEAAYEVARLQAEISAGIGAVGAVVEFDAMDATRQPSFESSTEYPGQYL